MARIEDLLDEALALAPSERAAIARELIASLEDVDPAGEVAQAWADEVERRVEAVNAGNAVLVPATEAQARIAARLKRRA